MIHKIYISLIVAFFVIGVFTSCEESVSIPYEKNLLKKVVVEGRITNEYKSHIIHITTTVDYQDTSAVGKADVSNAGILEVETGNFFELLPIEGRNGYFGTEPVRGKVGYNYQLTFEFDGDKYQASAYLDTVADMDSVSNFYEYITYFGGAGFYHIQMTATEPEPVGNIYMFNFYINDTLFNDKLYLTSYQNDELFNGQKVVAIDIAWLPQEEIKLDTNTIKVEMLSISREEFNFNNAFLNETLGNGSMFSGPPADVPSNVKNITGDNQGLGLFAASAVTVQQMKLIKVHVDSTNDPNYKK